MDVRARILDAALACFTEDGYERTTVARIRERSGVSNGALFHHFRSKETIAGALYVDAMRSVQRGHREILASAPPSVRAAVSAFVSHQLGWIEAHPDQARFLYAYGHLDPSSPSGIELAELNRELAGSLREWLRPLVASGHVREVPTVVLTAVLTGPTHSIAQRWLAGHLSGSLTAYAGDLVEAAVAALSGTPSTRRPAGAAEARVTVQLVAEDGTVLAEDSARARLPE